MVHQDGISSVYVIGRRGGPCKIGVSADPMKRLKSVQTGCAMAVEVWGYCTFPSRFVARRFERSAHDALSGNRLSGEWFDVEPEAAIAAIEASPGYYESYVEEDG